MCFIFSWMWVMRRAKRGLDRRHPCCVPDEERMVSPLEVMSLGSILYNHQARFVRSGHLFAESDIIKSRSAVLKAFSKSRRRIASPFISACCASAHMAWTPISYPPLITPRWDGETIRVISVRILLQ